MSVARRNGSSVMQMAVILACIAVVVISAVEFLGNNANTALEETAKDVADPARLGRPICRQWQPRSEPGNYRQSKWKHWQ